MCRSNLKLIWLKFQGRFTAWLQRLYQSAGVKRQLSIKAMLPIDHSVCFTTLICGHELRVVTESRADEENGVFLLVRERVKTSECSHCSYTSRGLAKIWASEHNTSWVPWPRPTWTRSRLDKLRDASVVAGEMKVWASVPLRPGPR